jgi:hypothetical protein
MITLNKPNLQTIVVPVVGTAPLIVHKWSEKAKKEMRDKQTGKAKAPKAAKDPQQDFEDSLYRTSDGYGFPAVAFKAAAVRAGTLLGMKMTETRQMFFVVPDEGDLIRIDGTPEMREDMVRLNGSTADIRYRGEFKSWTAELTIQHNSDLITAEQLVNLIEAAGFSVGVGEWRPEKNGHFGRFAVKGA